MLAAGGSTRMEGGFKLLLPYRDGAVVESVVRAAAGGGLDPLFVVVGHRAEEVRAALRGHPARAVENPDWERGQGGSLAAGIAAASAEPRVAAAVVLLGDEPGMAASAVAAVVRAWRRTRAPACRARYRDRPGHPVLFGRSVFTELRSLAGDDAGAEILRRLGPDAVDVPLDRPAPVDIDTREAYETALDGEP